MKNQRRAREAAERTRSVRLIAHGHANMRATHQNSLEFTLDPQMTQAGTCIIGVGTELDASALLPLRGPVRIILRCGAVEDVVHATMNPFLISGDPLIVRTHPQPQHRSLCIAADKGSAALDRALVAALRAPGAMLEATIEEVRKGEPVPGVLFVVGTPIGDCRDLSPRAEATLRSVDLILAEDTRTTMALVGEGCPKLMSLHDHNESRRLPEVVARLAAGERLALVSEAGMPLVSDPGFQVVRAAADEGYLVVPLPGPDATTAALSICGLPVNDFRFMGFLPRKAGERRKRLEKIAEAPYSTVLFEAPHRVVAMLEAIGEVLGKRTVVACRNLTKPGEEVLRGTAAEIAGQLEKRDAVRGEFTLVVGPGTPAAAEGPSEELRRAAESLLDAGVATKTIATALAAATGVSRRDMFSAVVALKAGRGSAGGKC